MVGAMQDQSDQRTAIEDYATQKGIDVLRAGFDLGVSAVDMERLFPREVANERALAATLATTIAKRS
jgi:hypothetical protein